MLTRIRAFAAGEPEHFRSFRSQREGNDGFAKMDPEKVVPPGYLLADIDVRASALPDETLPLWAKEFTGLPVSQMRESIFQIKHGSLP